jgi:membrane protein YqaA with SNARE-associated domain
VTETLLQNFGVYGGSLVIGFVAGLIPIISIELFLIGVTGWHLAPVSALPLLIVLAALGHQVAKTICYLAGVEVLERGKMKERVDKVRGTIERWNRRPLLVFFLASTVGFPPLYVLAFIAEPLMKIRFVPFTVICFVGRVGRYGVMALVPLLI